MRFFALLVALLALAAPVGAQATSPQDERARLHFESGRSYYEEGAYERALQEFQQAYALSPRTAMLYNLGTTMERLGMWAEAADIFQQYIAESPGLENRVTFERRVANLRQRAASHQQQGAQPATPTPQPTSTPTTPPATAASSGDGDALLIAGAVTAGVGGAGLVAFGILGGLALSEQSAVEGGCYTTRSCTPSDVAAMDDMAMGADIALIVGSVLAAGGVVLVILGVTSSSGDTASLELRPMASRGLLGLSMDGSF